MRPAAIGFPTSWSPACASSSSAPPQGDARREVFVKVRSTRPAQSAWLRTVDGVCEIELIDGEDGVSPGQACVFYDRPDGQARVLGGGFIASTLPMLDSHDRQAKARPLAASRA